MGRKLVRESDHVERVRRMILDSFERAFLFVADEGDQKGIGLEGVHTLCWAMPSPLTSEQMERLRECLVKECGAVTSVTLSAPGGCAENLLEESLAI